MEWISISQPPAQPDAAIVFDQIECIVTDGDIVGICSFDRVNGAGKPWSAWNEYGAIKPRHILFWMPLPKPPAM